MVMYGQMYSTISKYVLSNTFIMKVERALSVTTVLRPPPPIYTHHIFSRVEKSKKAHRINKHGLVAAVVQSRHKTVMAGVYN